MGVRGSHIAPTSLPELANAGRPLFPGNDVDDQLKRIFRYPSVSLYLTPAPNPREGIWKPPYPGAQSAGQEGSEGRGQDSGHLRACPEGRGW